MTEEQALIATILAHPADDLPRLVYADWLDEHGFHERAEFIRVQCELAKLEHVTKPAIVGPILADEFDIATEVFREWEAKKRLRKRERELWKSAKHAWFPQIEGENHLLRHTEECSGRIFGGSIVDAVECSFRRGFVESVRLPLAAFLGGECGRCHPGNGCPLCRQYGHLQQHHTCYECNYCSGTGRAEGIAKRLFESQPVLSVTLSDQSPYPLNRDERVAWFHPGVPNGREPSIQQLPEDVFNALDGHENQGPNKARVKWYHTREAANAALSTVLVSIGRSLADLPPLRATPPAEAEATETGPANSSARHG